MSKLEKIGGGSYGVYQKKKETGWGGALLFWLVIFVGAAFIWG